MQSSNSPPQSLREQYFARVSPLLGDGLRHVVLGAADINLTWRVVELLAACQLRKVALRGPSGELLADYLRWKNPFVTMEWRQGAVDLEIGATQLPPGSPPHITWEPERHRVTLSLCSGDLFDHRNLTYNAARTIRDIVLQREAWPSGTFYHGSASWPFSQTRRPVGFPPSSPAPAKVLAGRHILVVGCGSVGSEALRLLDDGGASNCRWTLVDGGTVSIFNPVRQWFSPGEVGQPKVEVLRRRLGARRVRALSENATPDGLAQLLERDPPDAVLLTTGTAEQADLARMLFERGIPHVVACAYPQARFFEVSVVLPGESTPCLHCFRGHLYRGRESAPPLSDELATFLYQELDPEQREQAYEDLVAEPADAIETGRIADVAAQCLVEALVTRDQRSPWLKRMIASGTTCLLGGNVAELDEDGPAYGLTYPGQVVRLGLADVVGVALPAQRSCSAAGRAAGEGHQRRCEVCGRRLDVVHQVRLPEAPASDVDRALLEVQRE